VSCETDVKMHKEWQKTLKSGNIYVYRFFFIGKNFVVYGMYL